jgi:hypothetical protein
MNELDSMSPGEFREFSDKVSAEIKAETTAYTKNKFRDEKIRTKDYSGSGLVKKVFPGTCEACVFGGSVHADDCAYIKSIEAAYQDVMAGAVGIDVAPEKPYAACSWKLDE